MLMLSIRSRLQWLVLAVMLPLGVLFMWSLTSAEQTARELALGKVKLLASGVAARLDLILRDQAAELARMVKRPQVRALDPVRCDAFLSDYVRLNTGLTSFSLRDKQGISICALGDKVPAPAQALSFPWFAKGLAGPGLVAGDVFLSPHSQRWVTVLTYPVQDAQGKTAGLLALPMDLLDLNARVLDKPHPDMQIAVLDAGNRVLLRSAGTDAQIGMPASAFWLREVSTPGDGVFTGQDASGATQLFARVAVPGTGWHVVVALPEVQGIADFTVWRNRTLIAGLLSVMLISLLAWRIGTSIGKPVSALAGLSARAADGDLSVRAPLDGPMELVAVARQFNRMMEARALTEQALQAAHEKLAARTEQLEITLDNISQGVALVDARNHVVFQSDRAMDLLELPPELRSGDQSSIVQFQAARGDFGPNFELVDEPGRMYVQRAAQEVAEVKQRYTRKTHSGRTLEIRTTLLPEGGWVRTYADVTDYVQALADKSASEALWKFALEGAGDGVWDWDIKAHKVFFSARSKELLGYAVDEMSDAPEDWRARVHVDDAERAGCDLQSHLEGRSGSFSTEHRIRCKDGHYKWILARGLVVTRDASGAPLRMVGTHSDIDERKLAEQALRESQERYRLLVEWAPVGIGVHRAGRILYINPAAVRMLGASSAEELVGRPMIDFVHPDFRPLVQQRVNHALQASGVMPMQHERFVRLDGACIDVEIWGTQIQFEGEPAVQVSFMDISERMQAQTSLKLAASVFSHAREGIMITEVNGNIIDVNETFTRITGYSREEALGRNPSFLQSGRQSPEFYTAMWQALITEGHWMGEVWNRRKNDEVYVEMLTISAVQDGQGKTLHYVALFTDITPMKEQQRQLEHIAHFDALTNLPNRVLLADRLQQAMAHSLRRKKSLAVAYLDLDGFKAVNDKHGHAVGDELLITIAHRLRTALRDGDTLARIGGDEFVAVLVDLERPTDFEPLLDRLLHAASEPVAVGSVLLQVSTSIGMTVFPQDGVDADKLMRHADQAMYVAKQAGKNRYHLFDVQQDTAVKIHRESLERIRKALDCHEFELYYQPKVNMRTGEVIGAEALIRWPHPQRGVLPPGEFLPVIEDHPVSVELGEWVITQALQQVSEWRRVGFGGVVSVNIGARQLQQADFVARLSALLAAYPDVPPTSLELEIIETSALADIQQVSDVMHACQVLGVRFALDDFGTGYSSLTYLKLLPAEVLKIDQSFVRDMLDDAEDLAIVKGVVGLASAFRREAIAEGVESVPLGTLLMELGCDLAQGYAIARPMPAREFPTWLATWRANPAWKQ